MLCKIAQRDHSFEQCAVRNGIGHSVCELSNFAQQQRRISDRSDGRSQRRPPSEARVPSSRYLFAASEGHAHWKTCDSGAAFRSEVPEAVFTARESGLQIAGTRRQVGSSIGSAAANAIRPGDPVHMTLKFPNHSRSYDRTRQAVRFWGYDTSIEYSFFVTVDALEKVQPRLRHDEEGFLGAFDAHRDLIFRTAANVFVRDRKSRYELAGADFR
jgi:hypothetical protein